MGVLPRALRPKREGRRTFSGGERGNETCELVHKPKVVFLSRDRSRSPYSQIFFPSMSTVPVSGRVMPPMRPRACSSRFPNDPRSRRTPTPEREIDIPDGRDHPVCDRVGLGQSFQVQHQGAFLLRMSAPGARPRS